MQHKCAYNAEDASRGEGLSGIVAAQGGSQALLQASHVRVGSEEVQAGSPGRCHLTPYSWHSLWEVLQQLMQHQLSKRPEVPKLCVSSILQSCVHNVVGCTQMWHTFNTRDSKQMQYLQHLFVSTNG